MGIPQRMLSKLKSFFREDFVRDITKLLSGTVLAQVINFALTPVLTRLFSPSDYGVFSVFTSIVSVLAVVACLRYEVAIVLPEEDKDAESLFQLSAFISLGFTVCLFPLFWFFRDFIGGMLKTRVDLPLTLLSLMTIFLIGRVSAYNYLLTRKKKYKLISIARVVTALSSSILPICFWLCWGRAFYGLVLGFIAGFAINFIIFRLSVGKSFTGTPVLKNIRAVAKRYSRFPIYDTWSSLLNNLAWQVVPMMLSFQFSDAVAGQYSLGLKMIQSPMSIIGASVGQVIFEKACREREGGDLYAFTKLTIRRFLIIAAIPIGILAMFGKVLFGVIFGREWGIAGFYTQILSPWAIVWFVASITSTVLIITERQRELLIINIIILASRILSLLVGKALGGSTITVVLLSATGFLVYLLVLIRVLHSAKLATPLGPGQPTNKYSDSGERPNEA
jgi:O-antigen/teichoic acid export membrane protein